VTKWFDLAPEVPFDRIQLTTARVLQQQLPGSVTNMRYC